MTTPSNTSRPNLTLPQNESEIVVKEYSAASVILEYGSGGSTVLAGEMPGKFIFSIESDLNWLNRMRQYFDENPPNASVRLIYADVGPTKKWGYPASSDKFRRWHNYPIGIWDLPDFQHPDLILIDGRFRSACFITSLFRITKPVTLLWDDYVDRAHYHDIESLATPVQIVGRMAIFHLQPTQIQASKLAWIISKYLSPQ